MRSATLPSMLTIVCTVLAAQAGPANEGLPAGEGLGGAPDTGGLPAPACVVDPPRPSPTTPLPPATPPTPPATPGAAAARANRLIIRPARPRITSRPRITWILSGPFAPGYTEPHGGEHRADSHRFHGLRGPVRGPR